MISVGIDPGAKGAFAVLEDGDPVLVKPWDRGDFIGAMLGLKLETGGGKVLRICVEKVGAMHGQGVTSMFTFGKSAGFIEGVLEALGLSYQLVPPLVWKKEFSLSKDKQQSIEVCRRLFPSADLLPTDRSKKPSDGMAEALLMAEYARRKL